MKPGARSFERERVRRKLNAELFGARSTPLQIGRFEVRERLGHGRFGVVYSAFDPTLQRDVGIKVLSGDRDPSLAMNEARALAGLSHPNILPIFETGSHEGLPYIVIELVEGGHLRDFRASLSTHALTRAEVARLLDVLTQVAHGLSAAHARGLVHRDVKPENILMGPSGVPKIADFGLAAGIDATDVGAAGTPRYAAPEQARGGLPDPRSDQYALCVMGLELLGEACPSAVRSLLTKGASPKPQDRHPSTATLASALERWRARERSRWVYVGAGIALFCGFVIASTIVALRRGPDAPSSSTKRTSSSAAAESGEPSALLIDKASQSAAQRMTAGDYRGCVDVLADDQGSAILSELRIHCARELSTKELREFCTDHSARHHATVDGCSDAELEARAKREQKDYDGCLRALEPLPWSPQRSILAADCANKLSTPEGYRRLCELTKKAPNAPTGLNCGGS